MYALPAVSDPDSNDEVEVYINYVAGKVFPSFLTFNNGTNTISLSPKDDENQG